MEWDRQRVAVARAGTIFDQRHERMREEIRREQDEANVHLNAEQKAQYVFPLISDLVFRRLSLKSDYYINTASTPWSFSRKSLSYGRIGLVTGFCIRPGHHCT